MLRHDGRGVEGGASNGERGRVSAFLCHHTHAGVRGSDSAAGTTPPRAPCFGAASLRRARPAPASPVSRAAGLTALVGWGGFIRLRGTSLRGSMQSGGANRDPSYQRTCVYDKHV